MFSGITDNMYKFNWNLFKRMPELSGITYKQWADKCGKTYSAVYRWAVVKKISVEEFVNACNIFRVSSSLFFLPEKEAEKKVLEGVFIPKELFKPIQFLPEKIGEIYGEGCMADVTRYKVAQTLSVNYPNLDGWIRGDIKISLDKFLQMLNAFELNINHFIIDENATSPVPFQAKKEEKKAVKQEYEKQLTNAIQENKSLAFKLKKKEERFQKLSVDYGRMKTELELLKNGRKSDPMSYKTSTGILCEPSATYTSYVHRKYRFHWDLFYAIPKLFSISTTDYRRIGKLHNSLINGSSKNVRLNSLIDLCNALHISITHFFVPEYEPLIVKDRSFYEISEKKFIPISSTINNLKYIFDKRRGSGITMEKMASRIEYSVPTIRKWLLPDEKVGIAVLAVADICSAYNIPPTLFFDDKNKKRLVYAGSQNETLLLNCVRLNKLNKELMKQAKEDKETIKRLEEELASFKKDKE